MGIEPRAITMVPLINGDNVTVRRESLAYDTPIPSRTIEPMHDQQRLERSFACMADDIEHVSYPIYDLQVWVAQVNLRPMCGRFAITLPNDAMANLFQAAPANDLPQTPNYNVCPTNSVHVIVSDTETRRLTKMRWGFVPHWYTHLNDGPLLINARSETLAQKPAFAQACRQRRCIIPASGFYEWTKDSADNRLPWYIYNKDQTPIAFAGLYQEWGRDDDRIATCAIVTTLANQTLSPIHKRMPVILDAAAWPKWLGEEGKGATVLMRPSPEGAQLCHRVDPEVNSNKAEGPQLIHKI